MLPKDPGSKDRESESTAHHTHSSLDPKQAGSVEAPASRFRRLVLPTDALNVLTLATCKDPSVAECFFKGRGESKPEIPWVQFPVPDHTRPEREAAFRAAASIREPAVQL